MPPAITAVYHLLRRHRVVLAAAVLALLLASCETVNRQMTCGPITYQPGIETEFPPMIRLAQATGFQSPPIIDGELSDSCWQAARSHNTFVTMLSPRPQTSAADRLEFKVGYDRNHVYVGITCRGSRPIDNGSRVIHLMIAPPTDRYRDYVDIAIAPGKPWIATRMNWNLQGVGWYHELPDLPDTSIVSKQSGTTWTVEAKLSIRAIGGWGADSFREAWFLQLAEIDPVTGLTQTWNPMHDFSRGPKQFGLLYLTERPPPLCVEYEHVRHLRGEAYVQEAVIRKLVAGPLKVTLRARSENAGEPITITLTHELTRVLLPCSIRKEEIGTYNADGYTRPVDVSIYRAVTEHSFVRCLYATLVRQRVKCESQANRGADTAFSASQQVVFLNDTLNIAFDLPVALSPAARLSVRLCDHDGQTLGETVLPLRGTRGVFPMNLHLAKAGDYHLLATFEAHQFVIPLKAVNDRFF